MAESMELEEKIQKHAEELRAMLKVGQSKGFYDMNYSEEYLDILKDKGFDIIQYNFGGIKIIQVTRLI